MPWVRAPLAALIHVRGVYMLFNVRFEHPLVGNKGDGVIVQINAGSKEKALSMAKEDMIFMGSVRGWQSTEYPIKDSYFHVYPAGKEESERVRVYEGDERL
jgi:hypothetical protein